MNVEEKRKYISQCYPKWAKVKTMPDDQVCAIYASCIARGVKPKPKEKDSGEKQLSIDDVT